MGLLDWCERGDSNPHGFTRQILSLVRLPIPPLSHFLIQLLSNSFRLHDWNCSGNCSGYTAFSYHREVGTLCRGLCPPIFLQSRYGSLNRLRQRMDVSLRSGHRRVTGEQLDCQRIRACCTKIRQGRMPGRMENSIPRQPHSPLSLCELLRECVTRKWSCVPERLVYPLTEPHENILRT